MADVSAALPRPYARILLQNRAREIVNVAERLRLTGCVRVATHYI